MDDFASKATNFKYTKRFTVEEVIKKLQLK